MTQTKKFQPRSGVIFKGKRLAAALHAAAEEEIKWAYDLRNSNDYPPHITEKQKNAFLQEHLERAERIRAGEERIDVKLAEFINSWLESPPKRTIN